jgi:hypothetical protein
LLVGFAGCDRVFGLTEITPTVPIIDSATGKDGTTITLIWHWDSTAQNFQFERTDPGGNVVNFDAPFPAAPFDDTGLAPGTSFSYRVRGVFSNGDTSGWSASVTGSTLSFISAYSKTLTEHNTSFEGLTVIQRINAGHLSATGPHVRVTVQASPVNAVSVDRIYISQVSSTGNPWDSAGDLTAIYDFTANQNQPFVVPAGMQLALPIVAYTINQFQSLLIAVDFTPGPASGVPTGPVSGTAYQSGVPISEASVYYLLSVKEAGKQTRSPNYTFAQTGGTSFVIFVTNIEVG